VAGHEHVQYDEVGARSGQVVQTLRAVAGELDVVPLEPQGAAEDVAERLVVVHDDYASRHLAPSRSRSAWGD
jgi:hypothetical protein